MIETATAFVQSLTLFQAACICIAMFLAGGAAAAFVLDAWFKWVLRGLRDSLTESATAQER